MDNEEKSAEEQGEARGRSVGGILAVMAAMLVLVITMQMCQ